jgi:hypothetical protein
MPIWFEWSDFDEEFSAFDRVHRLPKLALLVVGMTDAQRVGDERAKQIAIAIAEEMLPTLKGRIAVAEGRQ